MADEPEAIEWPREIWMREREEHDQGVVRGVLSEWATVARWEGDEERDAEFHRYVDADIYESAERYWQERLATAKRRGAERMREAAEEIARSIGEGEPAPAGLGSAASTWEDGALDAGDKIAAAIRARQEPKASQDGASAIAAERERQVRVEGWTPEHDDTHVTGELIRAAICYAKGFGNAPGVHWPWPDSWWKPKDRRSDLVRAGALIAAEIDRLDRADARKEPRT